MHCEKLSKVFFIVLIATYYESATRPRIWTMKAYHCASSDNMSASAPRPTECDTAEAAITDILDNLELVVETYGLVRAGRPAAK